MEENDVLVKAEQAFHSFLEQIEKGRLNDVAIRRAVKKFDVKNLKINNITPLRARKIYSSILPKYECGANTDRSWLQNQRRLFLWCAVCYLHKNSLEISSMVFWLLSQKEEDYEYLKTMFPFKDVDLLKFQVFGLLKKGNKNCNWNSEQDEILKKIILKKIQTSDIQWSIIAKEFFIATEQKYFRNAKQCRERWLNHLDPNKTKGKWLLQQDITLLKQVLKRGKKWSQIVITLEKKKNQHMVKNRYKSLIHKKQKQIRNKKIKQNDLIVMILKDLQNKTQGEMKLSQSYDIDADKDEQNKHQGKTRNSRRKQNEKKKQCNYNEEDSMDNQRDGEDQGEQQDQDDMEKEDFYQEEEGQNQNYVREQEVNGSAHQKKFTSFKKQDQNERNIPANSKNKNLPIIVDPNNKKPGVSASPVPYSDFPLLRNYQEQQPQDFQREIEIYGNKTDVDMFERLFQNAGTPNPVDNMNNRFPSMYLDSRSPGSMFMSPFPPAAGWTPTIFIMDGNQGQPSPQVTFGNFGAKFKSAFGEFLGEQQQKPEK